MKLPDLLTEGNGTLRATLHTHTKETKENDEVPSPFSTVRDSPSKIPGDIAGKLDSAKAILALTLESNKGKREQEANQEALAALITERAQRHTETAASGEIEEDEMKTPETH